MWDRVWYLICVICNLNNACIHWISYERQFKHTTGPLHSEEKLPLQHYFFRHYQCLTTFSTQLKMCHLVGEQSSACWSLLGYWWKSWHSQIKKKRYHCECLLLMCCNKGSSSQTLSCCVGRKHRKEALWVQRSDKNRILFEFLALASQNLLHIFFHIRKRHQWRGCRAEGVNFIRFAFSCTCML